VAFGVDHTQSGLIPGGVEGSVVAGPHAMAASKDYIVFPFIFPGSLMFITKTCL
jgi:hypothetical protein